VQQPHHCAQFRAALAAGSSAPVKARIMDQERIAGIGNLLADEILWRARVHPARPVSSLTPAEESRLLRASRDAIRAALRDGGVHTLTIVPYRRRGGTCPRDHAPMHTAQVGGRTSWWCSAEQLLAPGSCSITSSHGAVTRLDDDPKRLRNGPTRLSANDPGPGSFAGWAEHGTVRDDRF